MKIRAGDLVAVISGKDKGKTGTVLKVLPRVNRVVVSDVNMRTKHVRKTVQSAGQVLKFEASLHISNVMLVDPKTKKPTRVGIKVDEKGNKVRMAKKSGEVFTKKATAKPAAKKASAPKASEDKAEKVSKTEVKSDGKKPQKQAFWKRVGFGADALSESGEVKERPKDNSVPGESQLQSPRSHSRGS